MPPEKKKAATTNNPFDAMSSENPFDKIETRLSSLEERKRTAIEAILQQQAEELESASDPLTETFLPRPKPAVVSARTNRSGSVRISLRRMSRGSACRKLECSHRR